MGYFTRKFWCRICFWFIWNRWWFFDDTIISFFLGIPPAFAVANEANNILGTSVSGALTHWFKKTLDYKMGIVIVLGGIIGTVIGMLIFQYFIDIGKINSLIALSYIYLLAIVGTLMFAQGAKEISALKKNSCKKITHSLLDTWFAF